MENSSTLVCMNACICSIVTHIHYTCQDDRQPENIHVMFPAYSLLLFVIVMEAISREFRVALPWELLYADDLASWQ